jgi:hypothetical protein
MPRRYRPRPPRQKREPVFARHPSILGEEHERQMRPYKWIPYPYQLNKMDPAWLFVLFLFAGSFVYPLLGLLAGFIAFMRIVVWCSIRFPLTTYFFTSLIRGLTGGRRRW